MNTQLESPLSDTSRIRFSVRVKTQRYGDGRTFKEFIIVMRAEGKIVGVDEGPSRTHSSFEEARRAGWHRVSELRSCRLFIVPVTEKDIQDGESRSCSACAISQALYRNQERIGMDRFSHDFQVEPYGGFDPKGIVLTARYGSDPEIFTGEDKMPELVSEWRGKLHTESMYEWTSAWDDWADSRHMTVAEWREEHGYDDGETPYKPTPCSFVLNLSGMKPEGTR